MVRQAVNSDWKVCVRCETAWVGELTCWVCDGSPDYIRETLIIPNINGLFDAARDYARDRERVAA